MNGNLFLAIIFLSILVFFIPRSFKYFYSLFLVAGAVALTSAWSFKLLAGSVQIPDMPMTLPFIQSSFVLTVDSLSAFSSLLSHPSLLLLYARDI
jgi:hypothetical protein